MEMKTDIEIRTEEFLICQRWVRFHAEGHSTRQGHSTGGPIRSSPRKELVKDRHCESFTMWLLGTCECKQFKRIRLQQVGFGCLHHLSMSPLLNLHSQNDKVPFGGPTPPNILG